jgi:hypothetical protein
VRLGLRVGLRPLNDVRLVPPPGVIRPDVIRLFAGRMRGPTHPSAPEAGLLLRGASRVDSRRVRW